MSSKKLSTSPETESSFDLGIEGIASSEEVASSKNEYWTIRIPSGVSGTCNNTVTVLGIIDDLFDEVDFDRKLEDAGDLEVKGLVRKNGG